MCAARWIVIAASGVCGLVLGGAAHGQSVTGFTLIDAGTNQAVAGFDPIPDGASIAIGGFVSGVNIRANTSPAQVGSVVLSLSGTASQSQTENVQPYALFGDSSGNYNAWTPGVGSYTLSASAFSSSGGSGTTGGATVISFTVTGGTVPVNEPPSVDAGPDVVLSAGTSSVGLSASAWDADGTVEGVSWERVSGAGVTITGGGTLTPTVSGLAEGLYVFRVTVTDNDGASASDEVVVRVGDPSTSAVVSGELKQWHRVTLTFPGPFASEGGTPNPFLDYRMSVTFTDGVETYVVPGFFAADGDALNTGATEGDRWRVHFSPPTAGQWTYSASFRSGEGIAVSEDPLAGSAGFFDGESGTFTVGPTDKSSPDFRAHGLLEYAGGHYLRHRGSGAFFVKGGADSPENWLGYDGFDNTFDGGAGPNTSNGLHFFPTHASDWNAGDPDWDRNDPPGSNSGRAIIGALNYLHGRGINSIYFLPMNIGGDGKDSWPYAGLIAASGSSANDNTRFDVSKLEQWEVFFSHAQSLGILLHLVMNEAEGPNKLELDGAMLGTERRLFYREMSARFAHHNAIVWNVSEEYNLNLNIGSAEALLWAGAIKEADPYDHPVTVHNAGSPGVNGPWSPFIGRAEIDLTSIQGAGRTSGWSGIVEDFREATALSGRPLPVMIDEPGSPTRDFDNDFDDFRKSVIWPILLSGGGGEWFINNRDQSLEDFREFEQIWDETGFAREFVERYLPFDRMEPDDSLVSGANGGFDGAQVFALIGEVYGVYIPAGGDVSLDLGSSVDSFRVRWYNPREGGSLMDGTVTRVSGPGWVLLGEPPADGSAAGDDWAVLVERVECVADWDGDGELAVGDILGYLAAWTARQARADVNADAEFAVGDILDFLALWAGGCTP